MKFDKYIADYLYQQKELSLADIGTFSIADDFKITPELDVKNYFPQEGIVFVNDRLITTSLDFITHLTSIVKKPLTVITADLDDYLSQLNTWLSIGKSVAIKGVGTLTKKSNTSEIEFKHGALVNEKISFASYETEKYFPLKTTKTFLFNKKITLIISVFIVAIISVFVWAIKKDNLKFPNEKKEILATNNKQNVDIASSKKPPLTITKNKEKKSNDTVKYKMIFLATQYKEKAEKIFNEYVAADKIKKDTLVVNDTLRYRLFIYKKASPNDTTQLKKEFENYFKRSILVESVY